MKKFATFTLVGLASAMALSATAASAQQYGDRYHDGQRYEDRYDNRYGGQRHDSRYDYRSDSRGQMITFRERVARLERQIDNGVRRGVLTTREAQSARLELNRIQHRREMYSPQGYNRAERAEIDRRLDRLEVQVRMDRRDDEVQPRYSRR
jgi:hypothetical protein